MRALKLGLVSLFVGLLAAACSSTLTSACEQKCYQQKTNEPRDFDDCIKRCRR